VENAADSIINATPQLAVQLIEGGAIETILNSVESVVKIMETLPHVVNGAAATSQQQLTESIEQFVVRLVTRSLGSNVLPNTSVSLERRGLHTDEAGLVTVAWETVPDRPRVELEFGWLDCTNTNIATFTNRLLVVLEDLGVSRSALVAEPEVTCEGMHVVVTVVDRAAAAMIEEHVAKGDVAIANDFGIYGKARLAAVASGIATPASNTITLNVAGATATIPLPQQQPQHQVPTAGVMIYYASHANSNGTLFPSTEPTEFAGSFLPSPVVSVSLAGEGLATTPVLESNVLIELPVPTSEVKSNGRLVEPSARCVWWDYGLIANNGSGGWSETGCSMLSVVQVDSEQAVVMCSCSHMTHFGVLFSRADTQLSTDEEKGLEYIMYIGTAIGLLGIMLVWCIARVFDQYGCVLRVPPPLTHRMHDGFNPTHVNQQYAGRGEFTL
jgi:hypothetical protein